MRPFPMGMQDLQQTRHGLAHGLLVSRGEMRSERKVAVDRAHLALLPQLPQRLCEVIGYEAKVVGEQALLELRCFPAGEVVVEPIKERRIDHRLREVGEQMRASDQLLMGLAGVPDEHDRCFGWDLLLASRK